MACGPNLAGAEVAAPAGHTGGIGLSAAYTNWSEGGLGVGVRVSVGHTLGGTQVGSGEPPSKAVAAPAEARSAAVAAAIRNVRRMVFSPED